MVKSENIVYLAVFLLLAASCNIALAEVIKIAEKKFADSFKTVDFQSDDTLVPDENFDKPAHLVAATLAGVGPDAPTDIVDSIFIVWATAKSAASDKISQHYSFLVRAQLKEDSGKISAVMPASGKAQILVAMNGIEFAMKAENGKAGKTIKGLKKWLYGGINKFLGN